jgi:uncharacterized protein YbjT (DUF2867 family)
MYLVTGATGNVGAEVVAALARDGHAVRALVRDPRDVAMPAGAQVAVGDLDRPETLTDALAGVSAVFLLPGYQDMPGLLEQIRKAGADRVVLLSGASAAGGDTANAISRYMILSERALRDSGLPWTIVRSKAFMSNALRWRSQLVEGDDVRVPFPTVRTAAIDPADIAAVVVVALVTDDHDERVHLVSGPESLLPADQVAVLAEVLGRNLVCLGMSDQEARQEMEGTMPVQYVDAFFDFYVNGALDESEVEPTVELVTGRVPRTFEQWALAHRDAFP